MEKYLLPTNYILHSNNYFMNYQMLKSIIDSLIQNFKCPDCQTSVSEKDVEVM
jgi:hypothetical protein